MNSHSHPHPTIETAKIGTPLLSGVMRAALALMADSLRSSTQRFMNEDDPDVGRLEARLHGAVMELARTALQEALQKKADDTAPVCPQCGRKLSRRRAGTIQVATRFGAVTLRRTLGWCARCQDWFCPADQALGMESGRSPYVQEMAALFKAKMPVSEASETLERATGLKLPPATLDRVARQVGQRAQALRQELDRNPKPAPEVQRQTPCTMVIEIDAWNIRERGEDWGRAKALRQQGHEPEHWHWAYTATVFRLSDRVKNASGRPLILERGFVCTRGGVDALREQLHAEALRRGLAQAPRILVIADGAAWIWNLASDRFPTAVQRLDLYHAKEHLWAVARELHGEDTAEAKAWLAPLAKLMESGQPEKMITSLEEILPELEASRREKVARHVRYFKGQEERMRDYAKAKERGEPLGSGAIEATCRQYQTRFKQPGAYWTKEGDEGLLCIQNFWRNRAWHLLFPHAATSHPSQN